jgi:hypothetical protein
VGEYLAEARAANVQPPFKKSITTLGLAMTMCMAFATASSMSVMRDLRDMTPEQKSSARAMVLPGYGKAMPAAPLTDENSTKTLAVAFHFRSRSPIDLATLKKDDTASATLERIVTETMGPQFIDDLQKYMSATNLERGKKGELPMAPPDKMHFELSFAEYSDLFFAKESHPVFTVSKDVDIPTSVTQLNDTGTSGTQPLDEKTTAAE